jgi:4-diphosphocytidyl-2-C-methyl-D-erythritol kinase
MTRRIVRARAFAKINLTLRVLGVRPDGYHELRTVFQSIALHDTLIFAPAKAFSLECDDPKCPADETNLVWRAAEAMWRAAGKKGELSGVRVRLQKRVPMLAGLGGGSSDAAATLRVLAAMWKVKDEAVADIARGLGADVAFFLAGGTALGVERGDVLFPLADWPSAYVVLALPGIGVSTKDAYGWFDEAEKKSGSGAFFRKPKKGSRPRPFPDMWNDLQAPVAARHPDVARLAGLLSRAGASYAAMSGSGSAVFGLFDTDRAARRAVRGLAGECQAALLTRTLGHSAFKRRSRPA